MKKTLTTKSSPTKKSEKSTINNSSSNLNKHHHHEVMVNTRKLGKRIVCSLVVLAWFAFSIAYIGLDQYRNFEINVANNSYNQGGRDTAFNVIQKAKECKPFGISIDNPQFSTQLISVDCLKMMSTNQPQPAASKPQATPAIK